MYEATLLPFPEKTCSKCDRELPREAFNKRAGSADGLQAWCRECEHASGAERRQKDPAAGTERSRRWRAANPERARAATNRQYKANPDRRRDSSKRWRERNPDKVQAQFAAWRAANPEYSREHSRIYRQENPEAHREHARRRRARKAGNGDVEVFTRREIGDRDGWSCGICHLPIDPDLQWPDPQSQSLDHILALSLSGEHTLANCRIAHLICNMRRGNRDQAERDPAA